LRKLITLTLFILIALAQISVKVYANDFIAQELRETYQEGEVVLDLGEPVPQPEQVADNTKIKKVDDIEDELELKDNDEVDFEIFKAFDEFKKTVHEDSLFGEILHSKITRTDIPSYLLEDDLTFDFKKGPVSKLHPWIGYRGNISSSWLGGDYSTKYNNTENQIGTYGSFRNPNFKFQLTYNPVPVHHTNYLERVFSDTFIVNTSIPNHQIVAGYSRINTGMEGGRSSYILPFVNRSQIARTYGNYRSMGVKVLGNYQYVDYNLFAGSGGRYIIHGFPGAEFNSWINFKPFGKKSEKYGKLVIGGGYNHGHNRIDYNIGSAYISYNHKRLWTNFEAAIANGSNGSTGLTANKSCGWAYTLGWKINPHVQIIGRVDQFDPNRRQRHDLRREYTVGINWFIKGQALKVMLNYVFCDNQGNKDSHRIILGTQVLL
jgi:hypothetical protein